MLEFVTAMYTNPNHTIDQRLANKKTRTNLKLILDVELCECQAFYILRSLAWSVRRIIIPEDCRRDNFVRFRQTAWPDCCPRATLLYLVGGIGVIHTGTILLPQQCQIKSNDPAIKPKHIPGPQQGRISAWVGFSLVVLPCGFGTKNPKKPSIFLLWSDTSNMSKSPIDSWNWRIVHLLLCISSLVTNNRNLSTALKFELS